MGADVRVLLVEDDELIRAAVGIALGDEGFDVAEAGSGEAALDRLDRADDGIDVVLLDLMLPGMDGLAVCQEIRTRGDLPVIVVTARSASPDVVAGLEAGADDYVTKPLVVSELAARIRALLRRRGPASPEPDRLVAGEVEIRPAEMLVRRGGEPVHLTRTEFLLLLELARAAGRVVGRAELLHAVWGYEYFADTRLLDVHVRRLRRKIERDPNAPEVVVTVRGSGYRIGLPS